MSERCFDSIMNGFNILFINLYFARMYHRVAPHLNWEFTFYDDFQHAAQKTPGFQANYWHQLKGFYKLTAFKQSFFR